VRALIVNADDFGLTAGINHGIAQAHEEGIVTSASLMTEQPAAEAAAAYARAHPDLSVGLHVDLGEWKFEADEWRQLYERSQDGQLERFRELLGRDPTHLDSHQHAHLREPARSALIELAAELGVALRHFDERVRYCGDFYGQTAKGDPLPEAITVEALVGIIASLPEGTTELACHPGAAEDLDSSYAAERPRELEALCDPRVRRALEREGIELQSF